MRRETRPSEGECRQQRVEQSEREEKKRVPQSASEVFLLTSHVQHVAGSLHERLVARLVAEIDNALDPSLVKMLGGGNRVELSFLP